MSKTILIKKIQQAGSIYIGVDLPYDPSQIEKMKQIQGRMWSIPLRCWLIPYTKESYARLKSLFDNLQVQETVTTQEQETPNPAHNPSLPHTPEPTLSKVKMALTPKRILLQLPKNETDLAFIRSLHYARWDKNTFSWCITPTTENEALLKRFFGERLERITLPSPGLEIEQPARQVIPPVAIEKNKLLIIHFMRGRVRLLFLYEPALVSLIKTFPFPRWDKENKWWSVVSTPLVLEQLKEFCQSKKWIVEERQDERRSLRKPAKTIPKEHWREAPESFLSKLTLRRYSYKTIKVYKKLFREFINYYPTRPIDEITEGEILSYLRYLVSERAVSGSYQNQAMNAIKFYYEQVLNGNRRFYYVERPAKEKTLPVILSEGEVVLLLKSVSNIKHKCILMLLYSAGLRIGELLEL